MASWRLGNIDSAYGLVPDRGSEEWEGEWNGVSISLRPHVNMDVMDQPGWGTTMEYCHDRETWALIQYKDVILPVMEIPLWR